MIDAGPDDVGPDEEFPLGGVSLTALE